MSSKISIQKRINQLRKAAEDLDGILARTAKNATLRAIEAAQDATPPKKDTGRGPFIGVNMITGRLKASWASASKPEPVVVSAGKGKSFVTELNNDMDYASYVNNGHRMDRHFVPGLVVNEASGMLEYNPDGKGGIVVGTKTAYVKGLFMVDKAKEAYKKTVQAELKKVRDLLK